MTIKKVRGGYVITHHRTPGKIGQRIPATRKPVSYQKALSIHRSIFARRSGNIRNAHFRKGRKVKSHIIRKRR